MARVGASSSSKVSLPGFSTLSPGYPTQVNVGTTSVLVLPANSDRRFAHIFNNTQHPVFIQYQSDAALNQGIRLNPGTYFELTGNDLWLGDVNAIALIDNQLLDVLEAI